MQRVDTGGSGMGLDGPDQPFADAKSATRRLDDQPGESRRKVARLVDLVAYQQA